MVIVIYCQVRVRIIEGRHLSGGNISPVVYVTVANQSRQTRVKKSTNKPLYDEVNKEALFLFILPSPLRWTCTPVILFPSYLGGGRALEGTGHSPAPFLLRSTQPSPLDDLLFPLNPIQTTFPFPFRLFLFLSFFLSFILLIIFPFFFLPPPNAHTPLAFSDDVPHPAPPPPPPPHPNVLL